MPKPKVKPGPKADSLKLEGPWEDAVRVAVQKPRPPGGWPKPDRKARRPTARKS